MGTPSLVATGTGATPFHAAVERGHIAAAKALLVSSALNPEHIDNAGQSALVKAGPDVQQQIATLMIRFRAETRLPHGP